MLIDKNRVFIILFALLITSAFTFFISTDITLAKSDSSKQISWQLISVPCDVSMEALAGMKGGEATEDPGTLLPPDPTSIEAAKKSGDTEIPDIFEWTGSEYTEATSLKAGHGYVAPSTLQWPGDDICTELLTSATVTYSKGWNIIGCTGYPECSTFYDEFGYYGDSIRPEYFALDTNKGYENINWQSDMGKQQKMNCFEGYWSYFDSETIVSISREITIELFAHGNKDNRLGPFELAIGEKKNLGMRVTIEDTNTKRKNSFDYNISGGSADNRNLKGLGEISISNSNPGAVTVDDNWHVAAVGSGTAYVTASIGEYVSNTLVFNGSTTDLKCDSLTVMVLNHKKATGAEVGDYDFRDGADSPWKRSFEDSNPEGLGVDAFFFPRAFMADYNRLCSGDPGDGAEISEEQAVQIAARCKFLDSVLETMKTQDMNLDGRIHVRAVCEKTGGDNTTPEGFVLVDDLATWSVSDDSITAISKSENGPGMILKAEQEGTVTFTANAGGAISDTYNVEITERKIDNLYLYATTHAYGAANEFSYFTAVSPESELKLSSCTGEETSAGYGCYFAPAGGDGQLVLFTELSNGTYEKIPFDAVTWEISDNTLGSIDGSGILTTSTAGELVVKASFAGYTSNPIRVTIFQDSRIDVCDTSSPNTGVWWDNHTVVDVQSRIEGWTMEDWETWWADGLEDESPSATRATITTDCNRYNVGDPVNILYTAQVHNEIMVEMARVCLDLMVKDSDGNTVRSIRYAGCDKIPAARTTTIEDDDYNIAYEYLGVWDMKDDEGNIIAPGDYTAFAQFNILLDPIVTVDFTVVE